MIGLALFAGCWNAGFSGYDDALHVTENPLIPNATLAETFKPTGWTYLPLTILSYQLDYKLFGSWMPGMALFRSWAPGIRLMNFVYHAGAALILWRILLLLGLSRLKALALALIFAAHPTACETVCWISERKNALAGLFGFAALWAWIRFEHRNWRPLPTLFFFVCALLSKPSALGLLPVFVLVDLFGGARGISGDGPSRWKPGREWVAIALQVSPLAAIAAAIVWLNIKVHATSIVAPPGGSAFTALLTDLEILSRYLFNLIIPVRLSAYYYIDPICSVSDLRVAGYGCVLLAVVGMSLHLAANRRRAAFGWLWFIAALATNLNVIANAHFMQDRYLYLSLPGFFLVLMETIEGIANRIKALSPPVIRAMALAYIGMLVALSGARGADWKSMLDLFRDAVEKQPQAAFAHFGYGSACGDAWQELQRNKSVKPEVAEVFRKTWLSEWEKALSCTDAPRFVCYYQMALALGDAANENEKPLEAERYWRLAAYPPPGTPGNNDSRALAFANLASLKLKQQGSPETAYQLAGEGLALSDIEACRYLRANAGMRLAEIRRKAGDENGAAKLCAEAAEDLESIKADSSFYTRARKLLQSIAPQ